MSIDWSASSRLALARKSAQIISRQYPPDLSYTACLIQLEVDDPHSFESRPVSSFSTSRLNLILWQGMRFVQPGSTIEVLPMPPGYFRQSKPFVQPTSFRLSLADARGWTSGSKPCAEIKNSSKDFSVSTLQYCPGRTSQRYRRARQSGIGGFLVPKLIKPTKALRSRTHKCRFSQIRPAWAEPYIATADTGVLEDRSPLWGRKFADSIRSIES
jgi:hypothetical protein